MILDVNGLNAHASTGGVTLDSSRTGPVLLLIHGAGMDSTVWSQQTRFLNHRGVRAVSLDLPGHGQSEGEALTSVAAMAEWVIAFADAAEFGSMTVAGHSMGSFVCLELGARYPERITGVGLLGTATGMPVHPELLEAASNDVVRAAGLMTGWSHATQSRIGLNPTPGMWMTGSVHALIERSAPGVLRVDLDACAAYADGETSASKIECPVTIIAGHQDKMTPMKSARTLAASVRELTWLDLPTAGHMMLVETPRDVRGALRDMALASLD